MIIHLACKDPPDQFTGSELGQLRPYTVAIETRARLHFLDRCFE